MPPTAAAVTYGTKVPVSLRLPRAVVEAVERYASEQGVSKTDAFLHFIEGGMNASRAGGGDKLDAIGKKLDRVLDVLESQAASGYSEVVTAVKDAAVRFAAVERAYLFGSFARGDYSASSDVDIRLVLDRAIPFSLRDLDQFAKRVERATGREVDVVTADVISNPALADAIESNKVMVYERKAD